MKKQLIVLGIALLSLVACKDKKDMDENMVNESQSFSTSNKSYSTPIASLQIYQQDSGDSYVDKDIFFSNYSVVNADTNVTFDLSDLNLIYLDLNSNSLGGQLEEGQYTFSELREPFTIVDAFAIGNATFKFDNSAGIDTLYKTDESSVLISFDSFTLTDATVNVSKDGPLYTIDYNLNFGTTTLTGRYEGDFDDIIDESDENAIINNTPKTTSINVKR